MTPRGEERERPAGLQRLALPLFATVLIVLFAGFAIAQGIGDPDVPSGDVAIVEDVPAEIAAITQEDFDRALAQHAAQAKLKKTPEAGGDKYEELKTAAMGELLDQIWIQGQAEDLDLSVTDKQIEDELETIKKQNFGSDEGYEKFLEESKFTQEDVDDRVRLQLLSTQIQQQVNDEAPKPSDEEIEAYYEAEKNSQFTTKETVDVRIITNEDEADVEAARKVLEKDNSPASWKRAAAAYSSDPATKKNGGLQSGVQRELLPSALKGPLSDAVPGELIGPVKIQNANLLLEVVKVNPEKVRPLDEVRGQISGALQQETQERHFAEFVSEFQSKWTSRTFCADDFVIEKCDNYVGDGHPSNAAPGCYEKDPKAPVGACPALVTPTSPALPGSITPTKPQGNPLPQGPVPPGPVPSGEPDATP